MRKLTVLLAFLIVYPALHADEGMWLPMLLKQLNEKDMKSMGMKISAEEIYSINKSSMKDGVVLFGRGCTGELISSQGLLLTNHHCGFGQIQDHTTLENDYLKDGFWASDKTKELPNPGLTVAFIVRMEDVTPLVLKGMSPEFNEREREDFVATRMAQIADSARNGTHYEAIVKPIYNGNEFLLIISEVFRDIRLVGAPPQSIGNFGKDSDNWMWPRHTADFSLFRIYAGADNKPADYSPDNKPYTPKYHFKISTSGISENDFTMVYGFPARTNEYLTSYAVDNIVNVSNPLKVDLRGKRLGIMNKHMNADRSVFIKYADKYSGISNYHKKWAGEARGLKRANAIEKKKLLENTFISRVSQSILYKDYSTLIPAFESTYKNMSPVMNEMDLISESILTSEIIRFSYSLRKLAETKNIDLSLRDEFKKLADSFFKDYHKPLDMELSALVFTEYYNKSERNYAPESKVFYNKISEVAVAKQIDSLYKYSFLDDEKLVYQWLSSDDSTFKSMFLNDPAWQLASFYYNRFYTDIVPEYRKINAELSELSRKYTEALRIVIKEKKYYPDANQTLRVAYGKVEGYYPADAIEYNWFTTAEGILQKNDSGNSDYEIPGRLRTLIQNGDYGTYADKKDGKLHTCFAASNHTTGGNSGSPVVNANGHLIGTNFDRNWEGTMSDVYYDINQVRNVIADIRYTLFIIDKFAGAGHLVAEMEIVD
jgi:hypothetical protein